MKINKRRSFFAGVLVLGVVIGILEITLGLLAFVSPRVDWLLSFERVIPDARLGYRPKPGVPGHDRNGFRNQEVPDKAAIVALGDSQTYGTGVAPEDAWPRQLESMLGKTVYSMAYGGYGPTHSLVLWDEAVALLPKIVIEAFYVGNDLFDSFSLVYNQGQLTDLESPDPRLQASVREAELSEPIAKRVTRMYSMAPVATEKATAVTLYRLLAQHSRLYGLLHRAQYESMRLIDKPTNTPQEQWEAAKAFAEAHPTYCQMFSNGQFKTIFTSEYRISALDLGDPRILEGLQISLRAMQRMHELAASRNIRFIIVLIPTKETVFRQFGENSAMSYRRAIESEERVWQSTKDFLVRNSIEYLDALPALREQLMTGVQPYQVSHDGHPNEHGHAAIAKLVAAHLASPKTAQAQAEQDAVTNARMSKSGHVIRSY
jgi:lysophospholipase L1-like esterase